MPIIELPAASLTRSKQMAGGKEWIKQLDQVDTTKTDGYAFTGQFRAYRETVEVPDGTWFLDYYRDMSSSGRERGHIIILWQVQAAELAQVRRWNLDAGKGWALKVRDEIAALMTPAAPPAEADTYQAALERYERATENHAKAREEAARLILASDEEYEAAHNNLKRFESSPGIPKAEYVRPAASELEHRPVTYNGELPEGWVRTGMIIGEEPDASGDVICRVQFDDNHEQEIPLSELTLD